MSTGVDKHLVYMANQIALFFKAQGDAAAVPGIADHIAHFWDPSMRKAIFAHLDQGGSGLSPNARAALESLRGMSKEKARRDLARAGGKNVARAPGDDAG